MVNKATAEKTVGLKFQYLTPGTKFYYYALTGGTDNADFSRMVFINRNGSSNGISGGPSTSYTSTQMYAKNIAAGIKIALPVRSVVYVIVEKK